MGNNNKLGPSKNIDTLYSDHIASGREVEFLQAICGTLDVGVSILDENDRYQFISAAVHKLLGIAPEDLKVGDPLSKCHDLMIANGLVSEDFRTEEDKSKPNNSTSDENATEDSSNLFYLGNGETHRFLRKKLPNGYTMTISDDVTELVETDRLLNEALSLGRAGYWKYDIPSKTYELSLTMQKMLAEGHEEKVRQNGIFAIVHPEDRPIAKEALKKAPKNKDRFIYTARALTRTGKYMWGKTIGDIIRDKRGKPIKIRAFVVDIARERRQEQELMKAKDEAIAASHAKSEFLANMSHEIRTPMNGILGMAELLSNSDITERQRDFLNVINNSASALLAIINDILDFSKIEAGAFELDPTPFDLKSSINDVTSILSPKAQEKGLELIINYPSKMGTGFIGDSGRFRQVLINLVGNAIKFTENGHITIDVNAAPPRNDVSIVNISVKDTGIGLAPEKLEEIFKKFTQADGSTTRMYGGTGLGLSITKAIVEMMDGRISVTSTVGEGSNFKLCIPFPIDKNAIIQQFDTATLAGKRVLIIDDIETNRVVLTEQLQGWDLDVDSVNDGVEALTQLKASKEHGTPYDIILLDYLMPGMNGQELASIIANNEALSGTPIIMISSCDQPMTSEALSEVGINAYLMKPVREQRLFNTILSTLTYSKETHEASQLSNPNLQRVMERPKSKGDVDILVAEDFPLNQDVVRLMLEDSIYNPVFANNGKEALDLYKEDPSRFAVILMDVSMPVMDGYEATKMIAAYESAQILSHIPVIALTGHALKNDREVCLEAGMDDYLTKPVKQAELLNKLELWSGRAVNLAATAS